MRYFGGKNGDGTFQRIINQIPPHSFYVEPFAGSAAICRHKRPAARTLLIDLDPAACIKLGNMDLPPETEIVHGDGLEFLQVEAVARRLPADAFLYVDPPYLHSTRSSRKRYRHELTDEQHVQLLSALNCLPCYVMLSAYQSPLYTEALGHRWRLVTFSAITRGGMRTECLWMNFPPPAALHDYTYLGTDYRQRENIRRQKRRWVDRLRRMDRLQRQCLLEAVEETRDARSTSPPETPRPPATPAVSAMVDRLLPFSHLPFCDSEKET